MHEWKGEFKREKDDRRQLDGRGQRNEGGN